MSNKDSTPAGVSPDAPRPPKRAMKLRTLMAGVLLAIAALVVIALIVGGVI